MRNLWYSINSRFSLYSLFPPLTRCSGILEEGGSKEHAFGVITPERTYHLTAESADDKR